MTKKGKSTLIVAQNSASCVKAKIDNKPQNRICRLGGEKDETVNHIVNERSKLAQKEYITWLVRMGIM